MAELPALIRELNAWAASYYPGRGTPPPELPPGPPPLAALMALFNHTTSAEHHLALVDLPPIREALEALPRNHPVREVVKISWARHLRAAREREPGESGS
jgi:hypothetical protein